MTASVAPFRYSVGAGAAVVDAHGATDRSIIALREKALSWPTIGEWHDSCNRLSISTQPSLPDTAILIVRSGEGYYYNKTKTVLSPPR